MYFLSFKECSSHQLCKTLMFLIVAGVFLIIYFNPSVPNYKRRDTGPCRRGHVSPSSSYFSLQSFQEDCLAGNVPSSLSQLSYFLGVWSRSTRTKCKTLWNKFVTMYEVETKHGEIVIPPTFSNQVLSWLSNSSALFNMMRNQTIYHVTNTYTHEHTAYNLLRSKRPAVSSGENLRDYINNLSEERRKTCDFCHYRTRTAEDVFGRVEGRHSGSAANSFKLDKWHSLILTEKHNALDLTEEEFIDWFNTSLLWFKRVNMLDSDACYPMMFWDNLPHAGASQFHPHTHAVMGENHYHGSLANQLLGAQTYTRDASSNYWTDLVHIHDVLGLTVRLGSAVAIAPLTSRKDHEVLLLSEHPNLDLFRLLFYLIQTYHNKLNTFCYSCGMAFPVMPCKTSYTSGDSLPAFIRIGTRGNCNSMTSDASSLELYFMYNVNVDPYTVIMNLNKTVSRGELLSSSRINPDVFGDQMAQLY